MMICLVGCTGSNVKESIPGTYHSSWQTKWSVVKDTLQIQLAAEGAHYSITRRRRIEYVQSREPEYPIEHWTAVYDERTQQLQVQQNGRVLSVDPKRKTMTMGITIYQKL